MKGSGAVRSLAAALAAAQGKFPKIVKTKVAKIESTKGSYSYKYADLADILEAVRPALVEQNLAVSQPLVFEDGHLWVTAVLLHASGEWIESRYPIKAEGRPQETGSLITYARRYTVGALLGIATDEDDDGSSASKSGKNARINETQVRAIVQAAKLKHGDAAREKAVEAVRFVTNQDNIRAVLTTQYDAVMEALA